MGSWKGECNRCGACCTVFEAGERHVCEHLIVVGAIERPDATLCAVHDLRFEGMPVIARSKSGREIRSTCNPSFPEGSERVPKGCSFIRDG